MAAGVEKAEDERRGAGKHRRPVGVDVCRRLGLPMSPRVELVDVDDAT